MSSANESGISKPPVVPHAVVVQPAVVVHHDVVSLAVVVPAVPSVESPTNASHLPSRKSPDISPLGQKSLETEPPEPHHHQLLDDELLVHEVVVHEVVVHEVVVHEVVVVGQVTSYPYPFIPWYPYPVSVQPAGAGVGEK